MTLRLDDADSAALRTQAEREGRSMQLVARDAVREYVDRRKGQADVAAETEWVVEEYREALRRLGTL